MKQVFDTIRVVFLGMACLWLMQHTADAAPAPPRQASKPKPRSVATAKPGTAPSKMWGPLSAEVQKTFFGSAEDELKKKPCEGKRRVSLHCRDKLHYVKSNESRHDAFRPYIRGLGGGYVGVGSDQNFTLIAYARSQFAWLMDYDPVVVWVNMIHRALILESPTRAAYLQKWSRRNRKQTRKMLLRFYRRHPDRHKIAWVYGSWGGSLDWHFRKRRKRREQWKSQGIVRNESWLAQESSYQYIRRMFQQNRIRVMKGDLLLNKSLQGIGKISHKLNIPVRVVYFSNAEQFWPYTRQFRSNLRALKMDKKSVILRTLASRKYTPALDYIWVYVAQPGLYYQALLKERKTRSVWSLARMMKKVSKGIYELGELEKR